MPKKQPVGLIKCPVCDFPDAEILKDKNGHHYLYDPDCGAQLFTRGDPKREKALLAKMRPVKVGEVVATTSTTVKTGEPAAPSTAASPAAPSAEKPAPKKSGLLIG